MESVADIPLYQETNYIYVRDVLYYISFTFLIEGDKLPNNETPVFNQTDLYDVFKQIIPPFGKLKDMLSFDDWKIYEFVYGMRDSEIPEGFVRMGYRKRINNFEDDMSNEEREFSIQLLKENLENNFDSDTQIQIKDNQGRVYLVKLK